MKIAKKVSRAYVTLLIIDGNTIDAGWTSAQAVRPVHRFIRMYARRYHDEL